MKIRNIVALGLVAVILTGCGSKNVDTPKKQSNTKTESEVKQDAQDISEDENKQGETQSIQESTEGSEEIDKGDNENGSITIEIPDNYEMDKYEADFWDASERSGYTVDIGEERGNIVLNDAHAMEFKSYLYDDRGYPYCLVPHDDNHIHLAEMDWTDVSAFLSSEYTKEIQYGSKVFELADLEKVMTDTDTMIAYMVELNKEYALSSGYVKTGTDKDGLDTFVYNEGDMNLTADDFKAMMEHSSENYQGHNLVRFNLNTNGTDNIVLGWKQEAANDKSLLSECTHGYLDYDCDIKYVSNDSFYISLNISNYGLNKPVYIIQQDGRKIYPIYASYDKDYVPAEPWVGTFDIYKEKNEWDKFVN